MWGQAAAEIQGQLDDLARHTQLCNMFDFSDYVKPAYEAVTEAKEAMTMAKDVWDCASMIEQQFKVRQTHLLIHLDRLLKTCMLPGCRWKSPNCLSSYRGCLEDIFTGLGAWPSLPCPVHFTSHNSRKWAVGQG